MASIVVGLQFKDFVMIAADRSNLHCGILIIKDDEDKILKLSDKIVMVLVGDCGHKTNLYDQVAANVRLYKIKNRYELGTQAVANFTTNTLAEFIEKQGLFNMNMLIGGHDLEMGSQMYCIDSMAQCVRCSCAAFFREEAHSTPISEHHHRDVTEAEAYQILQTEIRELRNNLKYNLPNFQVTVVDKGGIRDLPVIKAF